MKVGDLVRITESLCDSDGKLCIIIADDGDGWLDVVVVDDGASWCIMSKNLEAV